MKKTLLAIGLLSSSFVSFAQYSVGIKGGLNLSKYTGEVNSEALIKAGFNGGLVGNYEISDRFAVQAEVLFTTKGYKTDMATDSSYFRSYIKLNYIEIPILLKASFGNPQGIQAFALAGPNFSFLTSGKSSYEYSYFGGLSKGSGEQDIKQYYNTFDLGLSIGGGVSYAMGMGKIFAETRYGYGLTNASKDTGSIYHNTNLQFSVGYLFAL